MGHVSAHVADWELKKKMARQLKGKERKESREEKRARHESNRQAVEQAEKYVLPAVAAAFVALVAYVVWAASA